MRASPYNEIIFGLKTQSISSPSVFFVTPIKPSAVFPSMVILAAENTGMRDSAAIVLHGRSRIPSVL